MRRRVAALGAVCLLFAFACSEEGLGDTGLAGVTTTTRATTPRAPEVVQEGPLRRGTFDTLIPRPTSVEPAEGEFRFGPDTVVVLDTDERAATAADLLHDYLAKPTGLDVEVVPGSRQIPEGDAAPSITFVVDYGLNLGLEGYQLRIGPDGVIVLAEAPAGFGWAVQTIRQLLPPEVESGAVQPGEWALPAGIIHDVPRFEWRGVMLDVARHFFPPAEVQRVIDLVALYKLNRLHLHLTDDQGWRIEIPDYPALTSVGAATQLGGGDGGFYTQEDYDGLVRYAEARGVTVVPEIDLPGHSNAALASVPELNCDGTAPPMQLDYSDGYSTLCLGSESTSTFVETVIAEIAEITPGPYIHIGGDEVFDVDPVQYGWFMRWTADLVQAHGKRPIGWDELGNVPIGSTTIVQHWKSAANTVAATDQGAAVVMSPASHAYLDMKYDATTALGLEWAGFVDTRTAYEWEPTAVVDDVPPVSVIGVEAPLWTETTVTLRDVETMLLPRMPGYGEIGWSAPEGRSWDEYQLRLAAHAARWTSSGRTFTLDPVVPWPP